MDTTAVKAMMAEIAPVIREFVAASLVSANENIAALTARVKELEAVEPPVLEMDLGVVQRLMETQAQTALTEMRKGLA